IASMTSASRAPTTPRMPGSANRLAAALVIATQIIAASAWIRGRATSGSSVCLIVLSSQLRGQRAARRLGACGSPQFRTEFLGHDMRIDTVADDLRPDEDDELGADEPIGAVGKDAAERARQLVEQGDATAAALLALADEAGQQHGLAVGDRNRAL